MPCCGFLARKTKVALLELENMCEEEPRDYSVTTTPGQSTRSPVGGGNISAVHGQVRSMPMSPENDQR
jgi:hypothetical protein